jgi:Ca2+-binding RTX toxin-like protein
MKTLIDNVDHDNGPIMEDLLAQPAGVTDFESAPFNPDAPTDVDAGAITPNAVPTITGTPGDDILVGDENNNLILGFGGNDVLIGGAGADVLNGGDGIDMASYSDAPSAVTVDLQNPLGSSGGGQLFRYRRLLSVEPQRLLLRRRWQ